ncbi:MAG: hypothetical protein ABIZ70_10925 [Gemmatimonadales bacterium]
MSHARRDFLGKLVAGGAMAAGVPFAPLSASAPGAEKLTAVSTDWDMSWTDRVNGKIRAVFDIPQVGEEMAFSRATGWRSDAMAVYGIKAEEASLVMVFRHMAIPLVMNDAYWERFKIGEELKMGQGRDSGAYYTSNPIGTANFASFLASGGVVLGCNRAFSMVVAKFRRADNSTRDEATAVAKQYLIPGVILQPTGLFAVVAAQQAGCGYVSTT